MHAGVPAGENHLVVALFDDKSGKRITDADVTAKVSGKGSPAIEKRLDPMEIAGAMSYGGYFYMAGTGPYRIELRIGGFAAGDSRGFRLEPKIGKRRARRRKATTAPVRAIHRARKAVRSHRFSVISC